jgi:arylamine N-acetyltransferase
MPTGISRQLQDRVLERLGVPDAPAADLAGLRSTYAAWCVCVPFDNLAKVIALRTTPDKPLPGMDATEFFERWLAHNVGGTCWSTANALRELLISIGFDARRVAGSMRDTGYIGHGSVKVRIDDIDWLVDPSMLTDIPLPLTNEIFISGDSVYGSESEPGEDGTHIVWADLPPNPTLIPCRLLVDPTDHAYYVERFEASRTRSPFNDRLYIRRNRKAERLVLNANTRILKTTEATETRDLNPSELCNSLIDEFGVSEELVDRWRTAGALEASYAPAAAPPAPIALVPPSRRTKVV